MNGPSLAPGLDTLGTLGAGPLAFAQNLKLVRHTMTYAELVANGTTPIQLVGATAGKVLIPIIFTMETLRTNVTAGTTVPFQIRYNGSVINALAAALSATFANGPGATLQQYNGTVGVFSTAGSWAAGFDLRNRALMLVPTGAAAATGCVGSLSVTVAYSPFPL